ncbi:hypothetical protein Chor_017237, partial [Crotalus horridus]
MAEILIPNPVHLEECSLREHDQRKDGSDSKSHKIFVGGIPHNCGETELREYFKKFGV